MGRVRARCTPSLTGRMHMGSLRTTLYAYLIAKYGGGNLLLRIEDTDQRRFVEGVVKIIYQTLKDMGLVHDEGPDKDGGYGPYIQNECQASSIYLEYAKKLVEKGEAYYCPCIPERLTSPETTVNGKEIMTYDRHCLHLSKEEVEANLAAGMPCVTRQNNPATGTTMFQDEIYGDITIDNSESDDTVLIEPDGYPTYNLANVVDGHLMGITHMVRGNEYLSSSPRYNRPYATFGWDVSAYVHCPLTTDKSHHKLSRRSGHSSFENFLEQGFISQAVVNYVALLGWLPEDNREVFSLEEMVGEFDYHRMNRSPTVFDMTKLKWVNGEYMKAMDFNIFYGMAESYLGAAASRDLDLKKIAAMAETRIEVSLDIADHMDFFEAFPEYDMAMYTHKKMKTNAEISLKILTDVLPLLEVQDDFTNDVLYGVLLEYMKGTGVKAGFVVWPIRTTAPGKQVAPTGVTEIIGVLGKEESLARARRGIQMLEV